MSPSPWPARGLVACLVLPVGVLALEGVLSLGFERSLRARRRGAPSPDSLELEREQAVAARATLGAFRLHEDPLVGSTLELEGDLDLSFGTVSQAVQSDALGLRSSAEPSPQEASRARIVLLGDELVFGLGLAPEETLAAALERALATTSPEGAPHCRGVAVPGWNGRNALRFLLDHLDALAPELVVYVPSADDLADAWAANEVGELGPAPDPAVPDPLREVRARLWPGEPLATRAARAERLAVGLGASARLRLVELAARLAATARRLERSGARLALAFPEEGALRTGLLGELARTGVALPEVVLGAPLGPSERRAGDALWPALPSAAVTERFARALAGEIVAQRWLSEGARARPPDGDTARSALEASDAARARLGAALSARVVPAEELGLFQVLGGLGPGGTLGVRFVCLLPRGTRLRVRLDALEGAADLYPLEVRISVSGRELGRVLVPEHGGVEQELDLAPSEEPVLELGLAPADWIVRTFDGVERVVAARVLALESLP